MRKPIGWITVLLALAALGGCDRIQTAAENIRDRFSTASSSHTAEPVDTRYDQQRLADEAKLMAAAPGFAKRDGKTLTIAYDGKSVASFTADYLIWTYAGMVSLAEADGRHTYALVNLSQDEWDIQELVRPDGTLIDLDQEVSVSPDGHHLALGYGEVMYGGSLSIMTWTDAQHQTSVEFPDVNCYPIAWQDNDHFTAGCQPEGGDSVWTLAKVSHAAKGTWHLQETREVAAGDSNDPALATLTLRDQIAVASKPAPKPNDNFMHDHGYRRLTP